MTLRRGYLGILHLLAGSLFFFVTSQTRANTTEVDWTSSGFSPSQITINVGDEVDIVNYDYTYDLYVTGAAPEGFYSDIPPTDGYYVYYVPYVYNNPGTFSFSDQFGDSVTVTVNPIAPLSVAITAPTNNAVFPAPATFNVTAEPSGGTAPYIEVDFQAGTNQTGVAYSSPFMFTVTNLPEGNYNISAVVTDNNFDTATNTINISVGPTVVTNYILPADCAAIYSSGSVNRGAYLSTAANIHGGLEFAEFDTNQQTSILLELNPYGLPLFDSNVYVYGFDGADGTLVSSNFNSGTLIGVWTLPANPGYGQIMTYDVTSFVKSTKGPYFGFILVADGGDVFSSTSYNYGTPPELFAIGAPLHPPLTATQAGNQITVSWFINNSSGLTLQSSDALGSNATWNAVSPAAVLSGNHWLVTQLNSGTNRFFRLSGQ